MKPTTDTTKRLPGEGFKRPWPALSKTYAAMKAVPRRERHQVLRFLNHQVGGKLESVRF